MPQDKGYRNNEGNLSTSTKQIRRSNGSAHFISAKNGDTKVPFLLPADNAFKLRQIYADYLDLRLSNLRLAQKLAGG